MKTTHTTVSHDDYLTAESGARSIKFWCAEAHPGAVPAYQGREEVPCTTELLVDLDALSPLARFIASHTTSTLRGGSVLRAYSRKSQAEILADEGCDAERIAQARKAWGDAELDSAFSSDWDYAMLRADVTPEQHLNALARRIAEQSRSVAMDRDGASMMIHRTEYTITDADRAPVSEPA